jgi:molybdate transport system substrate-binding protein
VTALRILSAGAAKALVGAVGAQFEAATGARVEATFDAAGSILHAFEQGEPADLVILPDAMLRALASQGLVVAPNAIGDVATGVAIRNGDAAPRVDDAAALRAALVGASALYCPDIERSTAGRHFLGVLRLLGIEHAARTKLHAHPNGALAMAALAHDGPSGALGCTQVTEILYTPGVALVDPLPAPFELTTRYAIAQAARAPAPDAARAFAARLTSAENEPLRRRGGFENRPTAAASAR